MPAPALNLAQIATPGATGPAGAKAAAVAQPGGVAAGFEALVAALFATGAPATPTPTAGPTEAKGDGKGEDKGGKTGDDLAPEATTTDEAAPDAAAALAAAATLLAATPTETPPAATTPAAAPEAAQPPAADGKGRPAFALASRDLPPGQAHADLAATDAVDGETEEQPASAPVTGSKAEAHADKPVPPAFGRDKPPGVPAQPALDNANPKADLAAKAAAAVATDAVDTPPPAPADTAPAEALATAPTETAAPAALTAQAARPEPAPAPAKPAKAERKAAVETANATTDPTRPLEAADKPVQAKAAQAAGEPASETVEAVDGKTHEAKTETDQPDATPQSETRAAAQSSAAVAHAANEVRGSPHTVATLAAQIVKKLEAKTTRFDLELDPAGLGRVDVRVEIGAHGKMTAAMVCDNPQAAHELRARAAELQRALEQAGFDLSGGLSFDVADQGRQQGQAWQDQGETGRGFRGQAFRAALETAGEAADAANTGALRLRRGVNAGVDVRI